MPIGVFGKTDRAGLGDSFEARGDIDAVAHQVAVALLDHVAQMDADAEHDPAFGRHAGVALDEAVLHLDRAAHGVDHAAELDEAAVAGALHDAAMMHGDCGIDQVAAKPPQSRQRPLLVRSGEPAVADHVGDQDRRDLPGFRTWRTSAATTLAQSAVRAGLKCFWQPSLPKDRVGCRYPYRNSEIAPGYRAAPNRVAAASLPNKDTAGLGKQFAERAIELRRHSRRGGDRFTQRRYLDKNRMGGTSG